MAARNRNNQWYGRNSKPKISFLLAGLLMLSSEGCQPTPESPPQGTVHLQIGHRAGTDSLVLESAGYPNAAGNSLRFTKVKYFLSGWALYRSGEQLYERAAPRLVHAAYPSENQLKMEHIPPGKYDSLSFHLGVIASLNQAGQVELPAYDQGMYWPEELGGGYHFAKIEGHWRHGSQYGTYAFHLGRSKNIIPTGVAQDIEIQENKPLYLQLDMNVLGWFDQPHLYDLRQQPGYTMGIDSLMQVLCENGQNLWQLSVQP